ncbi:MAG: hypothetical protein LUD22_03690 [Coprobacillus sp.]|nr:hypothetical protein [Coprobacillus sp.]
MAKIKRLLRCHRCGMVLQSEDPTKDGYIPASVIEREAEAPHVLYCQKCFDQMKVVNESALDLSVDEDVLKILDDAVATDARIIWVINLFTFSGILPQPVVEKVKKLKVAVVGTKADLFPTKDNETTINHFKEYLESVFAEVGISPVAIRIVGKNDSYESGDFVRFANRIREGHDLYMVGAIGSGKTVLMNRALVGFENKSQWKITREIYPGTDDRVLSIPLSNSSFIYELPGLSLKFSVLSKVEKEVQNLITPKKAVKITTRKINKGNVLALGSLASFELRDGEATTFKIYTAEGVENKEIAEPKFNAFLQENRIKRSLRPVSEYLKDFSDYDLFEYTMDNDGTYRDIAIEGLGWVSLIAKGQTIRVLVPHNCGVKETKARIY